MSDPEHTPRVPSPSYRLHEVTMAALTRQPRAATASIEVGMEARSREWYVKSLSVPQNDGEGWKPWLGRVGQMAQLALESLPAAPQNGGTE